MATAIITQITGEYVKLKAMIEKSVAQLADEDLYVRINDDANSIRVILKHLAGNMRSRFSDFLTSDGEKPSRNRDQEFEEDGVPRAQAMRELDEAWQMVFDTLAGLSDADLQRIITIRGEPHTVFQALNRQTSHYAYHVGQIVLLAKHIKRSRGEPWTYLTIPRGQSEQFNQQMHAQHRPSS